MRDDGPATHFSKVGTPTAGGVFFVPVALAATLALAPGQKEVSSTDCLLCEERRDVYMRI